MVYHQRRKGEKATEEDDETLATECASSSYYRRSRPKLFTFLFICLLSCSFILAPHLITFSLSQPPQVESEGPSTVSVMDSKAPLYSSMSNNGAICCDRSSIRSDVCTMKGDVRTHSPSSSIFIYASSQDQTSVKNGEDLQREKIKPYTRKWETSIMDTIDELDLIAKKSTTLIMNHHKCDVQHDVPAVFFSTGGYTGNVYHEFNDGIVPLYITSQHFNKKVVFVILEFHNWWVVKYSDILSHLSDYPVIDFRKDKRAHCFPEAIVGLKIHDELTVDSSLMEGNKSIVEFRNLLDKAYQPMITSLMHIHQHAKVSGLPKLKRPSRIRRKVQEHQFNNKPKLVIISRNGSRAITNENMLVKMAEKIGFQVRVLRPDRRTMLAEIYWALNSSDVMIGVHGAGMTHFLFMKPGSVFIQVIPLGTEWAAEAYYGEPAKKLGLNYVGYKILTKESSLYDKYDKDDPVLIDPRSVTRKGWQYTKMIYLEGQTLRLHLPRFQKQLVGAYNYTLDRLKQPRIRSY